MTSRVYGYSDDNVMCEGDFHDEIGCYDTDLSIRFSDGTILATHYGKTVNGKNEGIWHIQMVVDGPLFDRIEECFDSDARIYSDIAYFKDGITSWEVLPE